MYIILIIRFYKLNPFLDLLCIFRKWNQNFPRPCIYSRIHEAVRHYRILSLIMQKSSHVFCQNDTLHAPLWFTAWKISQDNTYLVRFFLDQHNYNNHFQIFWSDEMEDILLFRKLEIKPCGPASLILEFEIWRQWKPRSLLYYSALS